MKKEDKNTRYFIEIDLKTSKILALDYGQKDKLITQELSDSSRYRVFISKGQYNKLENKMVPA